MMFREYKLILEDNGDVVIFNTKGVEVLENVGRSLSRKLVEKYESKTYSLYLAESKSDPQLLKVGISNDVDRRMNELDAKFISSTVCNYRRIRTIEAVLHERLSQFRHHGEWYYFGDLKPDFIEWFRERKTQKGWLKWIFSIPMNVTQRKRAPIDWVDIIQIPNNWHY
ncbi:MAG: GIY-YIG nuclease family protein [Chthonomonadales bacterium]